MKRVKADLSSSYLGGVTRAKVVHGLLFGEQGDRREHSKGIASQQDDIVRMLSHSRELRIRLTAMENE